MAESVGAGTQTDWHPADASQPSCPPPPNPGPERQIIFINTMPKSASETIAHTLGKAYGAPFHVTIGGQYPNAILSRGVFQRLPDGRYITQVHVFPNLYNRMVLEEQVGKMVLHVRDPRQAIISWAHHLQNQFERKNLLPMRALEIPEAYETWAFEKKLDFVINHHLPLLVNWLQTWRSAIPGLAIPVLITRFEDMKKDPGGFFQRIIDFYGIEPCEPPVIEEPEPGKLHYRRGDVDEWRKVATQEQQRKMNQCIPEDILDHFQWPA